VLVAITGDRLGVNLISAVTAKGKLRFAAYDGHLNASVFIDFCRRLLHDVPSPVFLCWTATRCTGPRRSRPLLRRPRAAAAVLPAGVCARLNPDEWAWKHISSDRISRAGVTGPLT
jgi:hypothetical protein